jgi:branched-chain amino acid transport system ATP-binding protein
MDILSKIMSDAQTILCSSALTLKYDSFVAVNQVNLNVTRGHRHAIVGPNGAGKTSLFNLLTGTARPSSGTLRLGERDITKLGARERTGLGLLRSFQITQVFLNLTVYENLKVAVMPERLSPANELSTISESLELFSLSRDRDQLASALSYGRRRALELAMLNTRKSCQVLLLDEPSSGLGTSDLESVIASIKTLSQKRTLVFIEHNLGLVAALADRVTVMQSGAVIAEGSYVDVAQNKGVQAAYLGTRDT